MKTPGAPALQTLLVAVSTGALAALVLGLLFRRDRHRWKLPLSLPHQEKILLGHALFLGSLEGLRELCVDAASPEGVSRFNIAGRAVLSVLRAEDIKIFLGLSNFRIRMPIFKHHSDMLLGPNALIFLGHDRWKQVRRVISKAFSWECLRDTFQDISEISERFVCSLSGKTGEVLDMAMLSKCITVDVIGKAAFGHDFNCCRTLSLSKAVESFEFLLQEHTKRCFKDPLNPFNYFYWLPTENNRRFAECSKLLRDTINDIVVSRLRARDTVGFVEHQDILKHILDGIQADRSPLDPQVIADNLLTFLFAGYESSSITLAFAFCMMAKHPEIARRVRAEVLGVAGETGPLTYEKVTSELPLCTAVVNETLRLFPPAPITSRSLEAPLEFRVNETLTETLPAGTTIIIPIWWVHRSPLNFDNPDAFDPDRFLDPSRADRIHRFAHIPFSGGGRDCVGRRFAMLEIVAVLAAVMRRLSFECPADLHLRPELNGFTHRNVGGMPLKVSSH